MEQEPGSTQACEAQDRSGSSLLRGGVDVQLRPALATDVPTIASVTQAAYAAYEGRLDPPSSALREGEARVRDDLATGGIIVAEAGGQIVGVVRYRPEGDRVYLHRLAVLPAWRKQGIGRRLVRAAEEWSELLGHDRIVLGVRRELPENRALYERLGYHVVREVAFRSDPTRSYLEMERQLV